MKNMFTKLLLVLCVSMSLASFATSAEAYQCRWVRGYYHHGHFYSPHRVCWGHRNHHRYW
jgi:hypothetical protein